MRSAALVHVLVAAMLAVAVWNLDCFTWLHREIFLISTSRDGPATKTVMTFMTVFCFTALHLLPFLYLWAVRYCTLRFTGRCEISALQNDILVLSEAACSLRQLLLKLSPTQHAAQSSRAPNDHPSSGPSADAATEPTAATDPAVPNDVPDDQPEQQDSCPSSPSKSHETCSSK